MRNARHFDQLQGALKTLHIPYEIDPGIVRGLDYYTRTVFEVISNKIGAQGTICGGGRYDGSGRKPPAAPKHQVSVYGIGALCCLRMEAQKLEPLTPSGASRV